jgi:hypothetical protein
MAKNFAPANRTGKPKPDQPRAARPKIDGDGNSIANRILLGLSREESRQILPRLEFG